MSAEQPNRDMEALRATIGLGLDAKVFASSTLGKHMIARANAQRETALDALGDVDPEDPKAIRELQNTKRVAELFLHWLASFEAEGEDAERAFVEGEAQA